MNRKIRTVFVVGAGFSKYVGLPLTSQFTEALLEARQFRTGPSRILVEFLAEFISEAFGHDRSANAKYWPDLEDLFTCVDLSANSGHYLGPTFSPAHLRTVRRILLARIIRMLDHRYRMRHKNKLSGGEKSLDHLFRTFDPRQVGFISMNWDTVIERKLSTISVFPAIDYCCDAMAALVPALPVRDELESEHSFLRRFPKYQVITAAALPTNRRMSENAVPIAKIHGSANWLYCDCCRELFWFQPDASDRLSNQLITDDDLRRMTGFLKPRFRRQVESNDFMGFRTKLRCLCSEKVELGTRIATFSYRKALEFGMFQKSWFAAEELLRTAESWVFIGYSLPPADFEFKYLLKRVQLSRTQKPKLVVISGGGKSEVERTYSNYQRFFGRTVNSNTFFSKGLDGNAVQAACT